MFKAAISYYIAKGLSFFLSKRTKGLLLVGENLGNYARDNGYYFFKFLVDEKCVDNVRFVFNPNNVDFEKIEPYKKYLVRFGSLSHYLAYFDAKYCLVSHGYRDCVPEYVAFRKRRYIKPVIYLQHGVIKYKKLNYNSLSYSKNLLRFVVSSEEEKNIVCNKMMPSKVEHDLLFLRLKLWGWECLDQRISLQPDMKVVHEYARSYGYGEHIKKKISALNQKVGILPSRVIISGLPRFDYLIKDFAEIPKSDLNCVLVFPTWRESLCGLSETEFTKSDFYKGYALLLQDEGILSALRISGLTINFFLHAELSRYEHLFLRFANDVVVVGSKKVDVRDFILRSKFLVTDYSSISWDFRVLGKEVVFYQFDYASYYALRGTYAEKEADWDGSVCRDFDSAKTSIIKAIKDELASASMQKGSDIIVSGCCESICRAVESIPPKVYFVVYNIYGVGGTVRTTINSANYLYRAGFDVEIISLRQTASWPRLGLDAGIKVRPLIDARRGAYKFDIKNGVKKNVLSLSVRLLRKIPSIVMSRDEDLYHMLNLASDFRLFTAIRQIEDGVVVSTLPSLNIFISKNLSGRTVAVGQEHKYLLAHSEGLRKNIVGAYAKLDALTVLTSDDYSAYQNAIPPLKLIIQPNGTELVPANLISNRAAPRFICLARFVEQKGLDKLIRACVRVFSKNPDWTLGIYGGGELAESLVSLVAELGLQNNIDLNPAVEEVGEVLSSASFFVLPSVFEPFGMVVIEAFAHGLPVVCFDLDYGPKSLVENGVHGLKVQPFDLDALAESINLLIADPLLRARLGDNALKLVEAEYSIDAVGRKFASHIEGLYREKFGGEIFEYSLASGAEEL